MKQEIKIARQLHKFAKLAEKAGTAFKVPDPTEVIEASTKQPAYYEAEALLLAIEKPARFIYKICKREECKEPFGTNYRGVAYCSDNCRKKDLAKIGIRWSPEKSQEERWGGEPPLIVPPSVVKLLKDLLSQIEPTQLSYVDGSPQPDLLDDSEKTNLLLQRDEPILPQPTQTSSVFRFVTNLPRFQTHHEQSPPLDKYSAQDISDNTSS
jgi:hypothetical protein